MKNLSVKFKYLTNIVLALTAILVIGGTYIFSDQIANKALAERNSLENTRKGLFDVELRLAAKNAAVNGFFATRTLAASEELPNTNLELEASMGQLAQVWFKSGEHLIDNIRQSISDYEASIQSALNIQKKLGFVDKMSIELSGSGIYDLEGLNVKLSNSKAGISKLLTEELEFSEETDLYKISAIVADISEKEAKLVASADLEYLSILNTLVSDSRELLKSDNIETEFARSVGSSLDAYVKILEEWSLSQQAWQNATGNVSRTLKSVKLATDAAHSALDQIQGRVEEKFQTTAKLTFNVVLGSIIVAFRSLSTIGYLSATDMISALRHLTMRMDDLAGGNTNFDVSSTRRKDEFGAMWRSVEFFRDAAVEKERLEHDSEENRKASDRQRALREVDKHDEETKIQFAVDALANGLHRLSEGDLAASIDEPFMDSLDQLRTDFNASVRKLNSTLQRISSNTRSIGDNSHAMQAASNNLAQRAEQQATTLEETTTTLDRITATVKETTEQAAEAAQVANTAKADTGRSCTVVSNAVTAMESIKKASDKISNIINVIDEIAFQTNLLALNAGVEAARAGEVGKGFSVVAHEVRELAQRAANAATEIKTLITKSGEEVINGVELVRATGDALMQISQHVTNIDEKINTIATATEKQFSGIQEVNSAIELMDQVTRQNVAMSEETKATTSLLAGDTASLAELVNEFNLTEYRQIEPPVLKVA